MNDVVTGRGRNGAARLGLVVACVALLLAGCTPTVVNGRATSMLFNPDRVGGLPVTEGPSGPRPNAPAPEGTVEMTDNGPMDKLALLSVNDIQEFWAKNYEKYLPGEFVPVATLISYDSDDPSTPPLCGSEMYQAPNAAFCYNLNTMIWDRGIFLPVAQQYFGDMGVVGVIAHEYGHALQWMAGLADLDTPGLVREQQADCFAGVYLHWVAAGDSPRFTLSTGDGLNHVLAGVIYIRDRLEGGPAEDPHGSALDRVSAFQLGFTGGADQCAAIDMDEIIRRQGDLPEHVTSGYETTLDSPINDDTLSKLMDVLKTTFEPVSPPTLTTDRVDCTGATITEPTAYCPDSNKIFVDMPALQAAGATKNEDEDEVLVQGDNTALSMVTSRYTLALQKERGVRINTPVSALRTACLTGVAQGRMTAEDGADFVLSPGDTDEAVAGLLTNGMVASDVNGVSAPAGFTRILAYRLGLSSGVDECFERFS
ncbi:peptidase [Mycolicibacterium moriokaense]|uniref:peptidase n=1 Tax=Mycolicibacterium moriokaense TaxID=39691 RepID=UPI0009F4624F|nr:peptidase [Mycolicibacterium moriokaense]MCV7038930.1 peptidase [Mycolicibacterium moriokaense]